MKFKLNQRVAWVSQSSGTRKEKHGTVIRIVAAGEEPLDQHLVPEFGGAPSRWDAWSMPGSGFGLPRNHESYLVEVREGKRKPKLYWPVVARLEAD